MSKNITIIPPSEGRPDILRVAAYCRVSTDSEEQLNSYAAQKNYYTQKIEENPDWEMAGVFADATVIIGLNQQSLGVQGVAPV